MKARLIVAKRIFTIKFYCIVLCCNARSRRGLGYGDEELSKESSAKRSVRKNGISTESGIAWNCKDFAKRS